MLSITIDIHRNILSAQCNIRYDADEAARARVNSMRITGSKDSLAVCLYRNAILKHEFTILTPENFIIPTSVSDVVTASSIIEDEDESLENLIANVRHSAEDSLIDLLQSQVMNLRSQHSTFPTETNCETPEIEINGDGFKIFKKATAGLFQQPSIQATFRLQISSSEEIPRKRIVQRPFVTLYDFLKSQIQANELYDVVCAGCCNLISTRQVSFPEVKEYCGSLTELSESWFCHKHESSCPGLSAGTLYIDDVYIYLPSSTFESLTLKMEGAAHKCCKCSLLLSSANVTDANKQSFKKIFADSLLFKKVDHNSLMLGKPAALTQDILDYQKKSITASFWNVIKNNSQLLSTSRLYLQSTNEEADHSLLLWIPPVEVAQFKYQQATESLPSETCFLTEGVYKVQYFLGHHTSKEVQQWSREFNVEFYKVSDNFMKHVTDILKRSEEQVPGGKKNVKTDGFCNSYIPFSQTNML